MEPGWQIDPSGRFDYRYFNGEQWTSDVSVNGTRYVDTPTPHAWPPLHDRRRPRGMAITAFVLGLCGVVLGWIPFIFVFAVGAAIGAIVFGILGLRTARRHDGHGRGFAITGLVLSPFALLICVGGFFITRAVLREFRDYFEPGPHELVTQACTLTDGRATMRGTIHNLDDHARDYRIEVEFSANDGDSGSETVIVNNVAANDTETFTADTLLGGTSVSCRVTDVFGPLPFDVNSQG